MPMLGAATISGSAARGRSANGGRSSASPSCSPVTPSASQSRPGPAASSRTSSRRRRWRIRSRPVRRLQRAQQDRRRRALLLADEVEAPVDPVGAVDVRVPRRAEHDGVPRCRAAEGVAGRVGRIVGLDLDDRAADPVDEQRDADQVGRDLVDAAREEVRRERVRHPFRGSGSSRRSGRDSGLRRGSRLRRLRRRSRRRRSRSGGW